MADTLILNHGRTLAMPLSQVAHFRIEGFSRGQNTEYKLMAVSRLLRGDGSWFEIFIDEFKIREEALKRIDQYKVILEGRESEPGPEPPPPGPESNFSKK